MYFNAKLPHHLPLPRAVGPYTVIRTTTIYPSSSKVVVFAPFSNTTGWVDICGVASVTASSGISNTNNAYPIYMPLDGLAGAAEVLPCALTVQVMNPAALMEAKGLFAMGRVNQQLRIGGDTRTWDTLGEQFVSYFSPRMLTGGKLALQGVTCNAYPLDMSDYSDFLPIQRASGTTMTLSGNQPSAMSPIVIVQQSSETVELQILITMEWRVRFDPAHPAAASHSFKGVTPDKEMDRHIKHMASCGHGVRETQDVNKAAANGGGAF